MTGLRNSGNSPLTEHGGDVTTCLECKGEKGYLGPVECVAIYEHETMEDCGCPRKWTPCRDRVPYRKEFVMDDVRLQDAPERDRAEIERYIESHGGAIVLRVGDKIGSDARAAFVEYKKAHDYAEPPHDFVWIGEGTLGSPSMAEIEAAVTELRDARAAREAAEQLHGPCAHARPATCGQEITNASFRPIAGCEQRAVRTTR